MEPAAPGFFRSFGAALGGLRAFEGGGVPDGVGSRTRPGPVNGHRSVRRSLPSRACPRRASRVSDAGLSAPSRAETRHLRGPPVPQAAEVVSPGSASALGERGTLRQACARQSRPRLMRRRVVPVPGTRQRVSSPCSRRLNHYHARVARRTKFCASRERCPRPDQDRSNPHRGFDRSCESGLHL